METGTMVPLWAWIVVWASLAYMAILWVFIVYIGIVRPFARFLFTRFRKDHDAS